MKCPKCGYVTFEKFDRCRNCGYEFLLTPPSAGSDLRLRSDSDDYEALDDYALTEQPSRAKTPHPSSDLKTEMEGTLRTANPGSREPPAALELPLFGPPIPDDVPLITRPSPPRAPLAVRRSTPEVPRVRTEHSRTATLDLPADPADPRSMRRRVPVVGADGDPAAEDEMHSAHLVARFAAVVLDGLILAVVDAVVVYFTLQICGVTIDELGIVPKVPLIAFLVVQNVGYLLVFMAAGQTLGKMAVGIRVVPSEADQTIDLPRALKRTVIWLVLAIPVGLGFLTALFSRDRRGLHDRFAGTRVVRT